MSTTVVSDPSTDPNGSLPANLPGSDHRDHGVWTVIRAFSLYGNGGAALDTRQPAVSRRPICPPPPPRIPVCSMADIISMADRKVRPVGDRILRFIKHFFNLQEPVDYFAFVLQLGMPA